MDDVSFEIWSDEIEFQELLPILRDAGLFVEKPAPLHTRSLSPAEVTTVIVAISGAISAVARAFRVYFERSGKTFTASNLNGKIYAQNFTADEIKSIIDGADILMVSRPAPNELEEH